MVRSDDPSFYLVGVDIGTSYSAAAFADSRGVRVVSLGEEGTSIPSVLALDDDGRWLIGSGADHRGASHPELVIREFKRRHGDSTPFRVGEATITAAECVAVVYDEMVRRAGEQRGGPPAAVAATHPANWGPFKLDLFADVLSRTTDPPTMLVPEPLAIARAFVAENRADDAAERLLAVYDLGGGTFDVALVRVAPDGAEMIGTPGGVERLGGIDVDAALWHRVLSELDIDTDTELEPAVVAALARLRFDLVQAKHLLSFEPSVTIPVLLPTGVRRVRLDRAEFDRLVAPIIDRSIDHLLETIERNGLQVTEVDLAVLAGGSSNIALVAHRITDRSGLSFGRVADPQTAAARGAALSLQDSVGPARGSEQATWPADRHVAVDATTPLPISSSTILDAVQDTAPTHTRYDAVPEALGLAAPESTGRRRPFAIIAVSVVVLAVSLAAVMARRGASTPITAELFGESTLGETSEFDIITSGPTTAGAYGDSGKSSRFPSSGPLSAFSRVWEYSVPLTAWNGITVNDGVIYAVVSDPDERLTALDVASGRELWSVESFLARSAMTWANHVILVDNSAEIQAVDRADGKRSALVLPNDSTRYKWIGAAEVHDGIIYYAITEDDLTGSEVTYRIVAKSLVSGVELWDLPVVLPEGEWLADLAVSEPLVVMSFDAHLVAIDRVTGSERWRFSSPGDTVRVATVDEAVIVSSRRPDEPTFDLSVVDAVTGELRFSTISMLAAPTIIDRNLVTAIVDEETEQITGIRGLDIGDGRESWSTAFATARPTIAAIVEGPELFYVVATDGTVTALTVPPDGDAPLAVFESELDDRASSASDFHLTNGFLVEYQRNSGKLRVYR